MLLVRPGRAGRAGRVAVLALATGGALGARAAIPKQTERVIPGAVAVGPWRGHDWLAYARAGTTPPLRDYRMEYPGLVRPYATMAQDLAAGWSVFAQAENRGSSQRNERDNTRITGGRTVMVGARLQR